MEFDKVIYHEDGTASIFRDQEAFIKDRCHKATDRKIQLIQTGERLQDILKGANQLDKWNGFGSGYVYIREEIEEMSKKLKDITKL